MKLDESWMMGQLADCGLVLLLLDDQPVGGAEMETARDWLNLENSSVKLLVVLEDGCLVIEAVIDLLFRID